MSGDLFDPEKAVTREALAAMMYRYSALCPVFVQERADLSVYDDANAVSGWAQEAMRWAVEAALIEGTDEDELEPAGSATREQFAAIIERFDDTFKLVYNEPVIMSHYTEKPYPLVDDADVYVATDGDDENPGTLGEPLATFRGAVARVREIRKTKTEGDIVVAFRAGVYGPVEEELTAEDGGTPDRRIVYCKYGDGEVIFDNGATISEDAFLPLDEDEKSMFQTKYADRIKKVDIGSRIEDIPGFYDFALFSDEEMCTVARYPNKYEDGSDNYMKAAETYDLTTLSILNSVMSRRLAIYSDRIPEAMLYGYIVRGYRKDYFTLESYDAENKLLTVGYGSSGEFGKKLRADWRDADGEGIRMIVMNVPYELDHAGEYWVDRQTGFLYVFEPQGSYHIPLPHGEYKVRGINYDTGDGYPNTEGYCAIFAEDTGYITFRGIHFTNNAGEFIIGYKTSGFEIDRCTFDCCSGKNQTLFMRSLPDQPLGLRVTDSEFDLCTGRHVFVFDEASGPERFTNRTDALVDNCLFARSNLVFDAEGAVNLHQCSGGLVSHNSFVKCSRYAVMFTGSCDVIVEYNDFNSAMCNSDDGGITRGCGDILGNNVVRYNFYNSISLGSVGHFAHYCDNGDCGTEIYSNLIYNAGNVCYHGAGRDNTLNYNVMIDDSGSVMGSFTGAIIEGGELSWMVSGLTNAWRTVFGYVETVPGYAEDLEARRPGATSLKLDFSFAADRDFILAPTNTIVGNLFINDKKAENIVFVGNSEDYCTVEDNAAYGKDENPVFVNPTVGDYRIRDGVDFPDIQFEKIGRY